MSGRLAWPTLRTARAVLWSSRRELAAVCVGGLVISGVLCLSLALRVQMAGVATPPGMGDFWVSVMAGISQPYPHGSQPTEMRPLNIPFGWLTVVLLPCVLSVTVAREDGYLDACLVAVGSRWSFWLGHVVAMVVECLLYWGAVLACCVVATALANGGLTLQASSWLPDLLPMERATLAEAPYDMGAGVALAVVTSLAICLGQLALSQVTGVRVAFLVAVALVTGSLFVMSPVLPGNLMMAARSTVFTVAYPVEIREGMLLPGVEAGQALLPAAASCLLFSLLPLVVVLRRDYLGGSRS